MLSPAYASDLCVCVAAGLGSVCIEPFHMVRVDSAVCHYHCRGHYSRVSSHGDDDVNGTRWYELQCHCVLCVVHADAVSQMAKQHVIVRKLSVLENIGRVTDICSDKTGTLTQAKMVAKHLLLAHRTYTITGEVRIHTA